MANRATARKAKAATGRVPAYVLDDQVGFILRQVSQRHAAIFAAAIGQNLTPTQFAALAKLYQVGPCSQNHLGRLTAMDAATVKGVIDRLTRQGLAETGKDATDRRRLVVGLTRGGVAAVERAIPRALAISAKTTEPLGDEERALFLALLERLR